ncbi:hypothetical protein HNQ52_002825 [Chiayiivirga flava]|uniref:Uncharacterized protein n=1 Tax=Chiayiivirga flava TaxID=659595 RepID=A0A7W8D7Y8_9GAMM|nr:hypothetical protein [Chiayiivirga flava]
MARCLQARAFQVSKCLESNHEIATDSLARSALRCRTSWSRKAPVSQDVFPIVSPGALVQPRPPLHRAGALAAVSVGTDHRIRPSLIATLVLIVA